MNGLLPTVHTPAEVHAYKARLDPFALALDRSVASCPHLDPTTRRNWAEFFRGWRRFCDADVGWLSAANDFAQAQQFEEHIIRWQAWLRPYCTIAAPPLTRAPVVATPPSSTESTIKTVAIAGAVIAVAFAVRAVTK
jgi:hypothetical protein